MFEKVLVGDDGSERSEDALALARLLSALGTAGELIRARVHLLRAGGGPAANAAGDPPVRNINGRSAAHALLDLAETEAVDLVVVGSTGRGGIGRTFPGSTADRLLHGARCPIAVAPIGYRDAVPDELARVGAAVCTDDEAIHALETAAAVAKTCGAKLDVIGAFPGAAIERFEYGSFGTGEVVVDVRESAHADLEDAARAVGNGLHATTRLVDGSPAKVLIAQSAGLDLLVMGSHGYGPLGRVLLGSVSHGVVRACHAPVLVVPRGSEQPISRPARTAVGAPPE